MDCFLFLFFGVFFLIIKHQSVKLTDAMWLLQFLPLSYMHWVTWVTGIQTQVPSTRGGQLTNWAILPPPHVGCYYDRDTCLSLSGSILTVKLNFVICNTIYVKRSTLLWSNKLLSLSFRALVYIIRTEIFVTAIIWITCLIEHGVNSQCYTPIRWTEIWPLVYPFMGGDMAYYVG